MIRPPRAPPRSRNSSPARPNGGLETDPRLLPWSIRGHTTRHHTLVQRDRSRAPRARPRGVGRSPRRRWIPPAIDHATIDRRRSDIAHRRGGSSTCTGRDAAPLGSTARSRRVDGIARTVRAHRTRRGAAVDEQTRVRALRSGAWTRPRSHLYGRTRRLLVANRPPRAGSEGTADRRFRRRCVVAGHLCRQPGRDRSGSQPHPSGSGARHPGGWSRSSMNSARRSLGRS